jgi:hypothetical protein
MPLPHSKVHPKNDSKIEIIQEGCQILGLQAKPNYADVTRQLSEKHSIPVPYYQLCNHFLGKTKSQQASHEIQQLLSSEQEKVLVDWIEYLSSTGHPLSKCTIHKKAQDLCGKNPLRTGPLYFSSAIPASNWANHLGLTPNGPKHSIALWLGITSICLKKSLRRTRYHGRMSTIWMRKVIKGVGVGKLPNENILCLEQRDQNIRSEMQIWSCH